MHLQNQLIHIYSLDILAWKVYQVALGYVYVIIFQEAMARKIWSYRNLKTVKLRLFFELIIVYVQSILFVLEPQMLPIIL